MSGKIDSRSNKEILLSIEGILSSINGTLEYLCDAKKAEKKSRIEQEERESQMVLELLDDIKKQARGKWFLFG